MLSVKSYRSTFSLEEYDQALEYAKNNYEGNKGNQFHTQAYFNCLVNSKNAKNHEGTLLNVIENMRSINSDQSKEMADIADAIFQAKIKGNEFVALDKIRDCVDMYPSSHYPLLAMCDIAIKYKNLELLNNGFNELKSVKSKKHVSTHTYNKYKSYIIALQGDTEGAIRLIEKDLLRYPKRSKDRIIRSVRDYKLENSPDAE